AADGVTPIPGKGPLTPGSDYSRNYSAAPNCQLDIAILTAAGRIGPNERLIIRYRSKLDANTQNGAILTNVAGAIHSFTRALPNAGGPSEWLNGTTTNPHRTPPPRTLTYGTPGSLEHEDASPVAAALWGCFYKKPVADPTGGLTPATTAAPGDKLRYTLRFR